MKMRLGMSRARTHAHACMCPRALTHTHTHKDMYQPNSTVGTPLWLIFNNVLCKVTDLDIRFRSLQLVM